MPGVLTPQNGDWIRADAADLDRKLRVGDGIVWAGDPRLELRQGVITVAKRCQHPVTGAWLRPGEIVARCWEVWRACEDGEDRRIGRWPLHEFDIILPEIAGMRVEAPDHESVTDKIDAANAEIEARWSRQIQDNLGEAMEHGAKLFHDLTQPRNVFRQVGGLRDETSTPEGVGSEGAEGETSEVASPSGSANT